MSAVLNTNIASLWAAKNLLGAQDRLASSVERLSSGLRINRARDDAAGMGVAAELTSQINGANQGIRNLNDAISSVQTGDGALVAAQEMGQRILMLATEGANSTLGSSERQSIVDELKKLTIAIDAIGSRTTFAGNPLLSFGTNSKSLATYYSMQISNNPSDRIALASDAFKDVGGVVGKASGISYASTAAAVDTTATSVAAIGAYTLTLAAVPNKTGGGVFINGTYAGTVTKFDATAKTITLSVPLSIAVAANDKVEIKETTTGTLTLASPLPDSIVGRQLFKVDSTSGKLTALDVTITKASLNDDGKAGTSYEISGFQSVKTNDILAFGDGQGVFLGASLLDSNLVADPAGDPTLITAAWQKVQEKAAAYVTNLTSQRGLIGAYQNQMEYTLSNLTELSSNLQSARSRVTDTDYASETAALTRGQILQQAATAMLAQANQMPNVILTLLK